MPKVTDREKPEPAGQRPPPLPASVIARGAATDCTVGSSTDDNRPTSGEQAEQ